MQPLGCGGAGLGVVDGGPLQQLHDLPLLVAARQLLGRVLVGGAGAERGIQLQ